MEQEKLAQIMAAGRLAPSASNQQKWKLIADRPRTKKTNGCCLPILSTAPLRCPI
ncbi:nitroreductase family protein [Clostridium estertheticum]|uniref:nitroreductase family protein n=1 Tax=Clostridium estertheticum TaxID=238834 RepID=UPI001CF5AB80|nr:hypothetical protein [Clostridium estertheticum]